MILGASGGALERGSGGSCSAIKDFSWQDKPYKPYFCMCLVLSALHIVLTFFFFCIRSTFDHNRVLEVVPAKEGGSTSSEQ